MDVSMAHLATGKAMTVDRTAEREAAFRRLMTLELDRVVGLAGKVLGSTMEAEDAVHDAAILAWHRFGSLRDTDRFAVWYDRILVNVCRDRLRSSRRSRVVDVSPASLDAVAGGSLSTEPGSTVEDRQAIDGALRALNADQQIVLALRYGADLTVPAIAERLGVAEGTVKSRIHHGLRTLRAAIEAEERR
jgi:RNA polymerase sigma-70 factor (ECF subfamily)